MSEPGSEPLEDTLVVPFAERLLDCLCIELGRSLGGAVCQCCLRPGMVPAPMDACYCNCPDGNAGQASVQVTDVFPSSKFPRNQIDVWDEACAVGVTWVAELTMTVYRCVSAIDGEGRPPTCEQLERDFRVIQSDAAAMRRAFACCSDWALEQQTRPGGWKPIGPIGACGGGFMSVLVDVGGLCCPPDEPDLP